MALYVRLPGDPQQVRLRIRSLQQRTTALSGVPINKKVLRGECGQLVLQMFKGAASFQEQAVMHSPTVSAMQIANQFVWYNYRLPFYTGLSFMHARIGALLSFWLNNGPCSTVYKLKTALKNAALSRDDSRVHIRVLFVQP